MAFSLTYLLADDDEMYLDYTHQQLQKIGGLNCIGLCVNAFDLREQLQTNFPDFVILDIEMPGLTGVQLIKSLKFPPPFIFISSHIKYAADAFEVEAIDYLVKPVTQERLLRAIDKVKNQLKQINDNLVSGRFEEDNSESFFIRDKNIFVRIEYNQVLFIESSGNFSNFHLQNGTKKMVLANLAVIEAQLPANKFIRTSRSYIVNRQYITAIGNDLVHINGLQLPLGKSYADDVMAQIVGNLTIKRVL